jgi:ppGpp synthetase/RelA/SpoT-type nucleotidyltranferase
MTAKSSESDRDSLKKEFEQRSSSLDSLRGEALFALETALTKEGIKYHSIPTRVKTFDSFIDKVQRKESKDPFEEITDTVGLRVVALFLADISRIGGVIRKTFDVVSEDNKLEDQSVTSFGYFSVHFVARMKKEYAGPRYDSLTGLRFEIQVRTIAMDAWANVSHYLEYKTESDVPKELKRDFYALSGLFYVADTHFQMLFKAREESRKQLIVEFATGTSALDQPINLDTLTSYLQAKFPDRMHSHEQAASALVQELARANYQSISEIDEAVERTAQVVEKYERDNFPGGKGRLADIGVVRVSLSILDPNYLKARERGGKVILEDAAKMFREYRKLVKEP